MKIQSWVRAIKVAETERILFVDDELSIARMGHKNLERLDYSVTSRTSSIEALELFRAKPVRQVIDDA
jgi:CheY-like chemotaxis protein